MKSTILTLLCVGVTAVALLPPTAGGVDSGRLHRGSSRSSSRSRSSATVLWNGAVPVLVGKAPHLQAPKSAHHQPASYSRVPAYCPIPKSAGNPFNTGDYLGEMGGACRWPDRKCIRVYVAPGRPTFPAIVGKCFSQWEEAAAHRFTWCFTNNPREADYCINWTTKTHELSNGDEAGLTTTDTMVVPATGDELIQKAKTRVLTRYEGKILQDDDIEKTVLHEVGHGLGLEGHSSNQSDIMYYAVSPKQTNRLTPRDSKTISRLYR